MDSEGKPRVRVFGNRVIKNPGITQRFLGWEESEQRWFCKICNKTTKNRASFSQHYQVRKSQLFIIIRASF